METKQSFVLSADYVDFHGNPVIVKEHFLTESSALNRYEYLKDTYDKVTGHIRKEYNRGNVQLNKRKG